MNHPTFKIILISLIISFTACNSSNDTTSNVVFDKFSPTTKEYKNELATKLKSEPKGLLYTFNKYFASNGQELLDITIKGKDFEATGLVLVKNWNKLEGIKRTKGQGYSGAELRGLQIDIQDNPSGAVLVYQDVEKIVD